MRASQEEGVRLRLGGAWEGRPRALGALRKGDVAAALKELESLIAKEPESGELLALRSELKRSPRIARYSEALEDAEAARRLAPRSFWVQGLCARALIQAGRLEEGARALDEALRLEPACAWALTERALLRLKAGKAEAALADAQAACKADPKSRQGQLARAACLAALGRHEPALEALDLHDGIKDGDALPLPPAALPPPKAADLRFMALKALKRYPEAAQALAEAARRGERYLWGEPEPSLRELGEALRARPDDPWLRFWRGEALARLGRAAEAEPDLSAAIEKDPSFSAARASRAAVRLALGRGKEALSDVDKALSLPLPPGLRGFSGQLFSLRGQACAALRSWQAAAEDFTKALEVSPDDAWLRVRRAQARLALGQAEAAEADLREALERDPRLGKAYVLRGQLRSKRGNLQGALNDLNRAKKLGGAEPAPMLRWEDLPMPLLQPAAKPPRLGTVSIEPLIELIGLLQALTGPKPYQVDLEDFRPDGEALKFAEKSSGKVSATKGFSSARRFASEMAEYAQEAYKRFAPFADKPMRDALAGSAAAQGNATSPWYGLTQMIMGLSSPPEMAARSPEWRDPANLRLRDALRRFLEDSRFLEFFNGRAAAFAAWSAPIRKVVEKEAYVERVAEYVGVPITAYYDVILTPLLRDVTLCAILKDPDGLQGARTVLCPLTHSSDFYRSYDHDYLLWRGWHEILHMVVDGWAGLYDEEIAAFAPLYARVPQGARRKNWRDCVAEHMVRAVTQRLLLGVRGKEAFRILAERDRLEGYQFQDGLSAALARYESSRGAFPTLLDFYPDWLGALRDA